MMNDTGDANFALRDAVKDNVTVGIEAAQPALYLVAPVSRERVGYELRASLVESLVDRVRVARTVGRDTFPDLSQVGATARRKTQTRHGSGAALETRAALTLDVVEENPELGRVSNFCIAAFGEISFPHGDVGA